MNNQLIPVFSGTVSNESAMLCNARDLHEFLGIGKRFASWITERIAEYEFEENHDYIAISQNREIGHGRGRKEYHLTLDTAKELAMVERNDKGRQVRRYFIECEKRLRSGIETPPAGQSTYRIINTYRSCDNVLIDTRLVAPDEQLGTPQAAAQYMQKLMKKQGIIMIREADLTKITY